MSEAGQKKAVEKPDEAAQLNIQLVAVQVEAFKLGAQRDDCAAMAVNFQNKAILLHFNCHFFFYGIFN